MSEQPGDRVQSLFDQAVQLPPEQRPAFLEDACNGEPELRAEVDSLLAWDSSCTGGAGGQDLLKSPLVRLPQPEFGELLPKAWPSRRQVQVGRYRILRR